METAQRLLLQSSANIGRYSDTSLPLTPLPLHNPPRPHYSKSLISQSDTFMSKGERYMANTSNETSLTILTANSAYCTSLERSRSSGVHLREILTYTAAPFLGVW
ncbi:hypothetical protein J6590_047859 [Homalodisca vitripennis]|nr:hypothetical protein J6590_047859 [Homalodisca vitripennis]